MAIKDVQAGDLDRTVTLKSPVTGRNNQGSKVVTGHLTAFADIKAKIEHTKQSRITETNIALLNTDTVYIRYSLARTAINKDYLVVYDNGLEYTIHAIDYLGYKGKEWIELIVKAKTNG